MRQVPNLRIFIAVMCAELGSNMLLPLLTFLFFAQNSPLFFNEANLATRSLLFGLCLSLNKFALIIANTVITALSDHFGRKMALYTHNYGLILTGCSSFIALYTHQPALLIGSFFLMGLLDSNKAIAPAIMGDVSDAHNRIKNMGTIQCILALGACLGPIIGGELAGHTVVISTAYSMPFILVVIVGIMNLFVIRTCPETLSHKRHLNFSFQTVTKNYIELLLSKKVRFLFLILLLCQISWGSYYEFIAPALKNTFNYSASQVGFFMGAIAFWLILGSGFILRYLLKKINAHQLIWQAVLAILIGTLLTLFAVEQSQNSWSQLTLWLSAIPIAMGDVIFFSLITSFLSRHVDQSQQGKIMGLALIVSMLTWSVVALVGGYLMTQHTNGALLLAPLGAFALIFTVFLFEKPLKEAVV